MYLLGISRILHILPILYLTLKKIVLRHVLMTSSRMLHLLQQEKVDQEVLLLLHDFNITNLECSISQAGKDMNLFSLSLKSEEPASKESTTQVCSARSGFSRSSNVGFGHRTPGRKSKKKLG